MRELSRRRVSVINPDEEGLREELRVDIVISITFLLIALKHANLVGKLSRFSVDFYHITSTPSFVAT